MKLEFKSVIQSLPPTETKLLLQYIKGYSPNRKGAEKGIYITQGFLRDDAVKLGKTHKTEQFWRDCGYGLCWYDYSERQIESLTAKASKNKVIGYIIIEE